MRIQDLRRIMRKGHCGHWSPYPLVPCMSIWALSRIVMGLLRDRSCRFVVIGSGGPRHFSSFVFFRLALPYPGLSLCSRPTKGSDMQIWSTKNPCLTFDPGWTSSGGMPPKTTPFFCSTIQLGCGTTENRLPSKGGGIWGFSQGFPP